MKKMKKMKLFTALSSTAIIAGTALTVTSCSTNAAPAIDATVSIVGPDNVNVKCGETKQIDYTALVKPVTFSQDVTWTSTPIPDEYADKVTFNNGVLTFDEVDTMGSFDFTITAASRIDPTKTNTEKVTVNVVNADVKSIKVKSVTVLQEGNIFEADAGKEGSLTFTAAAQPLEASQQFKWTKGPEFNDEKIKNKIHFTATENAVISWDDNLVPNTNDKGEIIPYELSFTAVSIADPTKEDTFKLNLLIQPAKVTSVVITGPQTYAKTVNDIEQDLFTYTAKVEPSKLIPQDVKWSLENATSGDAITEVAKINENTGVLSYTPKTTKTSGNYKGTIKATPINQEGGVVGKLDVEIIVYEVKPSSIEVTGFEENPIAIDVKVGTGGSYTTPFSAEVQPKGLVLETATNITWNHSEIPSWASFTDKGDNTATLSWTSNAEVGTYHFNIWANCTAYPDICSQQQEIIFNVTRPDPTSIDIEGRNTFTIAEQTKAEQYYTAKVNPSTADQSVTWSITNYGSLTSDEITIDEKTGALKMFVKESGTYNIEIKATSTVNALSKAFPITLTVTDTQPQEVVITGESEIKTEHGTGGSATYTASVVPENAPQGINWSHSNLPNGVQFDNGVLRYDATVASGTHLITITATSSSKSEIKKDFNISLIVAHETPKTITINVPTQPLEVYGGENKALQLSASVNPTQAEQKVKWTLGDDAPTGVSIDPNSGLLSTGTQLEYKENESSTHIEYTEYSFKVIANSVANPEIKQEATIYIHVKRPSPTSVNIQGLETITIQNGDTPASETATYRAVVTPSQANPDVTWEATWDSIDHTGLNFDTTTGVLSYTNENHKVVAAPGTYTLFLTATTVAQPQLKSATQAVKIIVSDSTISNINVTCPEYGTQGVEAVKGVSDSTQLVATVTPNTAPQSVRWSVVTEGYGNQVTVDQNGLVSWNFNQVKSGSTFDIEIKATSTVQSGKEGSFTFHFTVDYATVEYVSVEGMSNINLPYGNNELEISYSAKVYPLNADQNVTWTPITSNLPDGVVWDDTTGTLKINSGKTTPIGYYPIEIEAVSTADTTKKAKYQVAINIIAPESESINISGESQVNIKHTDTSATVEKYYAAVVSPTGASQNVNWTATYNDSTTLPTGISFSNGKLTVDSSMNTGEYNIVLTASQNTLSTSFTVKVNVYNEITEELELVCNDTLNDFVISDETTPISITDAFYLQTKQNGIYNEPVLYGIEPLGSTTADELPIIQDSGIGHASFYYNPANLGNKGVQFRLTAVPKNAVSKKISKDITIRYQNNMTYDGTVYNIQKNIDPSGYFTTYTGTSYKTQNIPLKDGSTSTSFGGSAQAWAKLTSLSLTAITTNASPSNYWLYNCTNLTNLTLSTGWRVSSIGDYFLSSCTSLKQVDFPSWSLTNGIGIEFMSGCTSLESLTLPDTWTPSSIGTAFLQGCTSLKSLDLSKNLSYLAKFNENFLRNCKQLETLAMPDTLPNITSIDGYFMRQCSSLKNFTLPTMANLSSIGIHFMSSCWALEGSIDLSSSTGGSMTIGDYFLYDCEKITSVKFSSTFNPTSFTISMFLCNCPNLISVDLGACPASIFNSPGNYTLAFMTEEQTPEPDLPAWTTGVTISGDNWSTIATKLTKETGVYIGGSSPVYLWRNIVQP